MPSPRDLRYPPYFDYFFCLVEHTLTIWSMRFVKLDIYMWPNMKYRVNFDIVLEFNIFN